MELLETVEALAKAAGITYFGLASLSEAHDFVLDQGGEMIAQFPTAISLGITLPKAIVDQLPRRSDRAVAMTYRQHAYEVINQRLDSAASLIATTVQESGFKVFPVPASATVNHEKICGSFSHKLGAHVAGFGWIGKSCLLITPKDGPRVRFATVLTDFPFDESPALMEDQCGNCTDCVQHCPVRAFTGRNFDPREPRQARYDAKKCHDYFESLEKSLKPRVCGMCLYICPYGR